MCPARRLPVPDRGHERCTGPFGGRGAGPRRACWGRAQSDAAPRGPGCRLGAASFVAWSALGPCHNGPRWASAVHPERIPKAASYGVLACWRGQPGATASSDYQPPRPRPRGGRDAGEGTSSMPPSSKATSKVGERFSTTSSRPACELRRHVASRPPPAGRGVVPAVSVYAPLLTRHLTRLAPRDRRPPS
jgi:hypothetical protein